MTPSRPKRQRPAMRLPQLSKRIRLTRRHLGQWQASVQVPKFAAIGVLTAADFQ